MERKVIFRDTETGEELTLPVTPALLQAETAVNAEITNISGLGDISLPGKGSLAQIPLECLFPAQVYPFCTVAPLEPYAYVEKFQRWAQDNRVLRFVWSGTPVNIPVRVSGIKFSEEDGTNDVTAQLSLREYRYITVQLEALSKASSEEPTRSAEPSSGAVQQYQVVSGDTLSAIARKFYGDAALYPQLAAYNGIKNPNIISIGQIIKIPPLSVVKATAAAAAPSYTAPAKVAQAYKGAVAAAKLALSKRK